MPTIANSQLPAPSDPDEFEDIVLSALKLRWSTSELVRYGRRGQRQHGVDLFGRDDRDRQVGVQCKLTILSELTLAVVEAEAAAADTFVPPLDRYVVATTTPRDARLQDGVRRLSADRVARGGFAVEVLFWPDLIQDLAKDEGEARRHFPQYFREPPRSDRPAAMEPGKDYVLRYEDAVGRPTVIAGEIKVMETARIEIRPPGQINVVLDPSTVSGLPEPFKDGGEAVSKMVKWEPSGYRIHPLCFRAWRSNYWSAFYRQVTPGDFLP